MNLGFVPGLVVRSRAAAPVAIPASIAWTAPRLPCAAICPVIFTWN